MHGRRWKKGINKKAGVKRPMRKIYLLLLTQIGEGYATVSNNMKKRSKMAGER